MRTTTLLSLTSLILLGACVAYDDGRPVRIDSAELRAIRTEANQQIATWDHLAGQSVRCDSALRTHVVKAANAHHVKLRGYVEEIDEALAERQIVPAHMTELRQQIDADREFATDVQGMLRAECSV